MELTDVLPLEKWVELQEDLHKRFKLNADIMDRDGKRIAGNTWGNELCKNIRGDDKGFGAICAPSGQMFLQLMQKAREKFAEECDAGMLRVSVPIIHDGELLGAAGGCGLLLEDGEIEEFMIDMSTSMNEEEIAALAKEVNVVAEAKVAEIQEYIEKKISNLSA